MTIVNNFSDLKSFNNSYQAKESKIIILSENHTSKKAYETRNKLKELAIKKVFIYLDEGLTNLTLITPNHLPLEDLRVKLFCALLWDVIKLNALEGSSFINNGIDTGKNEIRNVIIFTIHVWQRIFFHAGINLI